MIELKEPSKKQLELCDNVLEENTFYKRYYEQVRDLLKSKNKNISDSSIKLLVIKNLFKDKVSKKASLTCRIENDYKNTFEEISLVELMNFIYDKKPIITGSSMLFKRHDEEENVNASFIKYMMGSRSIEKNEMKRFEDLKNFIEAEFHEKLQKTWKALNNSYYGSTGEANSQFYDIDLSKAVTYTGRAIITTSILAFESFMENNVLYSDINELFIFMSRCVNNKNNILKILDKDKVKNINQVAKYLCKYLYTNKDDKEGQRDICIYLKTLDTNELNLIYYMNNFYEFMSNSKPKKLLNNILKYDIINPNDLPKEYSDIIKDNVNKLWDLLKNFIVYDYQYPKRFDKVSNMTRRNILTVDTDSNFVCLQHYSEWLEENCEVNLESENAKYTIPNSAVLILNHFIQSQLDRFTANCQVPEEERHTINMKNEILYSRLMLTRNKKQYAGINILKEGHIVDEIKQFDIKGLSVKKTTVANRTRQFFTNLIQEDILKSKKIDIPDILRKYKNFEKEIEDDLKSGNKNFIVPGKVNDFNSYAFPFRMQSVRGTILWNMIYPELAIQTPDKCNIVKLNKISSLDDLNDIDEDIFKVFKNDIFKEGKIFGIPNEFPNKGIDVIALPKSVDKIPEWVIPFINIKEIIQDNITPGIVLLESLDLKTMEYNNREYYSNFIKI